MKASELQLALDSKFFDSAWCIRHSFGPQREKALRRFWRNVYKEVHHDDQRVFREFALNDYLVASDELLELEYPMRAPCTAGWSSPWGHRSSAVTVGSGMGIVGTGSVHSPRSHPVNTVGFSN
jgi:hypothetical protein